MLQSSQVKISPSLLSADPLNFAKEMADVEAAGADWHHVDVMDGHFVPNLTYGIPFVKALKTKSKLPLDVHIMISNPDVMAKEYAKAGADYLVFHIEATKDPLGLAKSIRQEGAIPGVAINPNTPVEKINELLPHIGLINLMSVFPGFSGQKFIAEAVSRVAKIRQLLEAQKLVDKVLIEVDGGINETTGPLVVEAGARVLVAGNFVYKADDRKAAITALRGSNKV